MTFLDDDDAYLPNYFQTLLAVFDANPSAGAAFGQMQMCDHRLDNPSTYAYPAGPMPSGEGLRYMLGTIVQQNAVMFRRTALADIGGYDETILTSEDWDIMMQLAAKHDVFGVEVPVCLIRQHAGLRMTNHMIYPQWVQYQRNCALVEKTARTIKGRVPIAWWTRRFGRFQLHGQSAHNTLQVAFCGSKGRRDTRRPTLHRRRVSSLADPFRQTGRTASTGSYRRFSRQEEPLCWLTHGHRPQPCAADFERFLCVARRSHWLPVRKTHRERWAVPLTAYGQRLLTC